MSFFERLKHRLLRYITLDRPIFREISSDPRALNEAAAIALTASLLGALGGLSVADRPLAAFAARLVTGAAIHWLLWAFVARLGGGLLYGSSATFGELARVMGYAAAPLALRVLALFACLRIPAMLLAWGLSAFYGFHALREVAGLKTESAVVTVGISSLLVLLVDVVLYALF